MVVGVFGLGYCLWFGLVWVCCVVVGGECGVGVVFGSCWLVF